MIQLNNLTEEQVDMLNVMWALDTEEEYLQWYDLLDIADRIMADGLMRLIIMESMEELVEETNYKDAKELLSKFAL